MKSSGRFLFRLPLLFAYVAAQTDQCATGVHVIVARGSTEDPGAGRAGVVTDNVATQIDGSTVVAVDYPATLLTYFASEQDGTLAMTALLEDYVASCPDGKVALVGYSQGAQAASNVVCGTSQRFFEDTEELSNQYDKNIVAVAMFGNPAHVGNSTWNAGTSTNDGIFPRQDIEACEPYISRMRSWCDTGDVVCDSGDDSDVHLSYFSKYTEEASDWVVSMYQAALEEETSADKTETGADGEISSTPTTTGDDSASSQTMPNSLLGLAVGLGALLVL